MTHAWLAGDHYKWRAMRTHGIPERLITGEADDREKFDAWARTIPYCIGNPLYHWTHLELKRIFGKHVLLSPESAEGIYTDCNDLLAKEEFRVRSLLARMNVRTLCTTDDPGDSLESHKKLGADGSFPIRVVPTFRPDFLRMIHMPVIWNDRIDKLEEVAGTRIAGIVSFIEAIRKRHDYFHDHGCRISDHAIETPSAEPCTEKGIDRIFRKARQRKTVSPEYFRAFQTHVLRELAKMDAEKGWTMQLHIGALRNANTRMYKALGPDSGFDSISDSAIAAPLARFLDSIELENALPRTVLYSLDPTKNETIATMLGNFQDGSQRGKIQFGPAWWFNDQKDGMERHLVALSGLGLLSAFIGMSTDSRSFLSFPRHEYFRRILCNTIGTWVEKGELPADLVFLGKIVEDICYNNALRYFNIGRKYQESDEKGKSR
jgi:glucuronate isomerase